jgi:hypothetical protein
LQITISSADIIHKVQNGDHWETIDTWMPAGRDLSAGRFGFYLPSKKDDMHLYKKSFAFQPEQE